MRAAALLLPLAPGLLNIGLLAGASPAPQEDAPLPPGAEGPLRNDVFLPVSKAATDELLAGDGALEKAREGGPDTARFRNEAFDAWSRALAAVPPGDRGLAWHAVDAAALAAGGAPRLAVGVEDAVLARIEALDEDGRRAWGARVRATAEAELERAGFDPAALAALERARPATPAAARAALLRADLALEEGRPLLAAGWCARGETHLALCVPPDAAAAAGLAARRAALAALPGVDPGSGRRPEPAAWRDASRLRNAGALALPDRGGRTVARFDPGPGSGVRAGLAFLADGRIAVQTEGEVHVVVDDARRGLALESTFEPGRLAAPAGEPLRGIETNGTPGWPLLPATDGRDLVLVVGRSRTIADFAGGRETIPNALVCVTPPRPATPRGTGPPGEPALPELRWAVSGDRRVVGDGPAVDSGLGDLPALELQPGPLVLGTQVLVQARATEGAVRAWLLAFDLATGELRWRTFLAKGSDLLVRRSRFDASDALFRRLAAQPPAVVDGRVFVGTHLGAGALVDPLDGQIHWILANRRRDPAEPAWDGGRPLLRPGTDELLWAPADSDRLYTLHARPRVGPAGTAALFAAPPHPAAGRETLVGGDELGLILLGRAGAASTVLAVREGGSERLAGVYLGRGEEFAGVGLAGARRTLAVSDRGVYLFDNDRELYLLAVEPLEDLGGRLGGEAFARGEKVYVVGETALWSFTLN